MAQNFPPNSAQQQLSDRLGLWLHYREREENQRASNDLPVPSLSMPKVDELEEQRSVRSYRSTRSVASMVSARVKLKLTELQIKQAAERRDLARKLD